MQVVECLRVASSSVHNVVFFSPQATLKKGPIPGVVQRSLCAYLMGYRKPVLSDGIVEQIVGVLEKASLAGDAKAVARHRTEIRTK